MPGANDLISTRRHTTNVTSVVFMSDNDDLEIFFGKLEAIVIDILFTANRPVSIGYVHKKVLMDGHTHKYTTIAATLFRLFDKGVIDRKTENGKPAGRTSKYLYWIVPTRKIFYETMIAIVIEKLIELDGPAFERIAIEALKEQVRKRHISV